MSMVLATTVITARSRTLPVFAYQTQAPRYDTVTATVMIPAPDSSNQKNAKAVKTALAAATQAAPGAIRMIVLGFSIVAAAPASLVRAARRSQNVGSAVAVGRCDDMGALATPRRRRTH